MATPTSKTSTNAEDRPAVQLISAELIAEVARAAELSPRRRMNFNFHRSARENPHRFLNVLLQDTYVAPHRHLEPPKSETFLVLEGKVRVYCFDGSGKVLSRHELGAPGAWGVDVAPGVWHTLCAMTPRAVCFEVKPGPWDPSTDKEFAPWAPREDDPRAAAWLGMLQSD